MGVHSKVKSAVAIVATITALLMPLVRAADDVGTYGSWHSSHIGGGGFAQGVALSPSDPDRAYAYVDVAGVFRSDDKGKSWTMLHGNWPSIPGGYAVRGISVDPRDSRLILAAVGDQWAESVGVMSSTDAGNSWKRVLKVPYFGNSDHRWSGTAFARHPSKPDVILTASVDKGVWKSRDNGATWSECAGAEGLYPSDIVWDRANPLRAWMCAQDFKGWYDRTERGWKGGLYRSDNGGTTWEKVAYPAPTEMLPDPRDPAIIYGIFGSKEIRRSNDGGRTWALFSAGLAIDLNDKTSPGETEYNALSAGPDFILTASTLGTFYKLKCGETVWEKVERQNIDYTLYGGPRTGGYLYLSRALANITVDPRNPQRWFCTDWFAIYQTLDGGRNWFTCVDGLETTVAHTLQQDPSDPHLIQLGLADIGYFRSEDQGVRFESVDWRKGISNNIKCLSLSPLKPERVFAVGCMGVGWESNKVFVSSDKGKSWRGTGVKGLPKDMNTHHCNSIAVSPADPDRVYVCMSGAVEPGGGGVYETIDAGRSWTWIGQGLPSGSNLFTHDIFSMGRELAVSPDGSVMAISRDTWAAFILDPKTRVWRPAGVPMGGSPTFTAASASKPGVFYVAADNLYSSEDGGQSWRISLAEPCYSVATDLAVEGRVAVGTRDGVKVSLDGGHQWQALDQKLPYRYNPIVAFAGDRVFAATLGCGVFWIELPADTRKGL